MSSSLISDTSRRELRSSCEALSFFVCACSERVRVRWELLLPQILALSLERCWNSVYLACGACLVKNATRGCQSAESGLTCRFFMF